MEVRNFGDGYHFLTEENPAKVVQRVSEWVNDLEDRKIRRKEALNATSNQTHRRDILDEHGYSTRLLNT